MKIDKAKSELSEQPTDVGPPLKKQRSYAHRNQIQINQLLHKKYKLYLEREEEKLIIAKALCSEGDFSYITYRKYMLYFYRQFELNYDRFDLVCTSFAVQIFRVLERFLSFQCQLDIDPLNRTAVRPVLKIIIKGRQLLTNYDFQTIVCITKFAYEIEDIYLQKQPCLSLYQSLINLSKLPETQKEKLISKAKREPVRVKIESELQLMDDYSEKCDENSSTYYVNKIWNEQHDAQLIKTFKEKQNFVFIAKKMRDAYPDVCKFFVPEAIKNRMRRILRGAIRKLKAEVIVAHKDELPKLLPIHDTIAKNVYRSPTCSRLQVILLNVLEDSATIQQLNQLIHSINKMTIEREQLKSTIKSAEK